MIVVHKKLNKALIESELNSNIALDELTVFHSIHSTNDALYERLKTHPEKKIVYFAETQTAGRGQHGKHWHSPAFSNIYCSLSWTFHQPTNQLQDLSYKIGKILLPFFKTLQIKGNITLKHPNDILVDNKKIAGVLIDTFSQTPQKTTAIIGIGINVHLTKDKQQKIDQPWTSLDLVTEKNNDRNDIAAQLINTIVKGLLAL